MTILPSRRLLAATAFTFAFAAPFCAAHAQGFPNKPIRIVVPYAAGGSTDQLARAIQNPMSEALGQPVVIDNKPGAGGTIGTDIVAKAPADGYTLVFGNSGPMSVVQLMRKVPYDTLKDLEPISTVVFTPMILTVPTELPVNNLKEYLAYARQNGGKMNYGSVGNGSLSHLTGEYFNDLAGIKIQHIPYNGGAPMMVAFASGQIQGAFVTGLDGASMVSSGKAKYLAVATTAKTDVVPDLPAIGEEVKGFKSVAWFGVMAPRGLPADVAAKLHAAISAAVNKPEVRKMFADRKVEAKGSTPAEMEALIREEMALWGEVVRKNKIEMN